MRSRAMILVGAMAAAAVWAGGASPPAGAAVVVTSSGTTLSATVTGTGGTVGLACVAGQVRVLNVAATPTLACSTITSATITADGAPQVFGPPSPIASFPALTSVTVNAGGGDDQIEGSVTRDVIVGGTGDDRVTIPRSGADDSIGLGGQGGDRVTVTGTAGGDGVAISTQSPSTQTRIYSNPWEAIVTSTATVAVNGGADDDILVASGLTSASTLSRVELRGDDGDDILVAGAVPATLVGGTGTNQLTGGPEPDAIFTTSPTDTIRGNGGVDGISDSGDGRVGRTIDGTGTGGSPDNWQVSVPGDVAVRTRTVAGDASVTVALGRTGRQVLDEGVGYIIYAFGPNVPPYDRAVLDLAPLGDKPQRVDGDVQTYVDIVVPTGSWSVASGVVSFTGPYEDITVNDTTNILVRAPYTNANLRFAHRLIRDLNMRFPFAMERSNLANALTAGTKTRAQAVLELTDTDLVRGIAVDRAFLDILRRDTDAAGRTYWIDRLDDGLVLRRLRANLYGSPEYVTEQGGGTNAGYVAAAYRDILGRTAAQAEIDYWVGQITDVGLTKGTVADRFLNTPEARGVVIRDLFLRWVDRVPTSGELSTWNTQLGSSSSDGELALIRFLAASAAYYTRPDA